MNRQGLDQVALGWKHGYTDHPPEIGIATEIAMAADSREDDEGIKLQGLKTVNNLLRSKHNRTKIKAKVKMLVEEDNQKYRQKSIRV